MNAAVAVRRRRHGASSSSSYTRRWQLVLALGILSAACNPVFGLDGTELGDPDRDGDGVADDADNCGDVFNDDQADADGDGLGDVCDLCVDLASLDQHDEDNDRLGDPCDPCPALRDFGDDEDGDGVGNLCDRRLTGLTRRLFDPLVALPPELVAVGGAWEAHGDEIAPAAPLSAEDGGLQARGLVVSGTRWWLEVGLHVLAPWSAGERIGVDLYDAQTDARWARCELVCTTNTCFMRLEVTGQPVVLSNNSVQPEPFPVLVLGLSRNTTDALQLDCEQQTTRRTARLVLASPIVPPVWPALYASPNTRLRYVEVVQ